MRPNYSYDTFRKDWRIKVMCPVCGAGGATWIKLGQPWCHVCTDKVKMLPASNSKCECTWEDLKTSMD